MDSASIPSSSGLSEGPGPSAASGYALQNRTRGLPSPAPHGRLASLRTRDLTLGGAFRKTKKTWEPNVHAVRKVKEEVKGDILVAPKKQRRERDGRRREYRDGRKARANVIQSHSIFEQCPDDSKYRTGCRSATRLHHSSAAPVSKPVKKEGKGPVGEDEDLLYKLQRDDFIDDPDLGNDPRLTPITLPLSHSNSFPKHQAPASTSRERVDVFRGRCQGNPGVEPAASQQLPLVKMLQELSVSGEEKLFLMQLPDCLPGRPSTSNTGTTADKLLKKEGKSAQLQPQESLGKKSSSVLSQFSEGLLGKLVIRKSGKMELKLGDIVLDVSEGVAFSFLQELVSVSLSDGRSGNLMVLGNVHHKLVLSPNFQDLLRRADSQQP